MRRFALVAAASLVILALVTALSITLVTVSSRDASQDRSTGREGRYDRAPQSLPVLRALERERVTFLRTQDWCQAYNDGAGVHANTLRTTCTLTREAAHTFDPVTGARYDTLAHLAETLPYDMNYVEVGYGRDKQVTRAEIALDTFFSRESLVYDPGYSLDELRAGTSPDPATYTPIDADWHHVLADWN